MNLVKRGLSFVALGLASLSISDQTIPSSMVGKELFQQTQESLIDLLNWKEKWENLDNFPYLEFSLSELKDTPLNPQKRMVQGRLGDLLGYSQAEEIMKSLNSFPDSLIFSAQKNII